DAGVLRSTRRREEAAMGSDAFAGVTAIVTGGASGIGRATADELKARGGSVAVLDRVPDDRPGIVSVVADVTDDAQVTAAVRDAAEQLGGLDVLVNSAGIGAQGGIDANDDAEWHRVFDVNVFGIVRVTRAALPYLRGSS